MLPPQSPLRDLHRLGNFRKGNGGKSLRCTLHFCVPWEAMWSSAQQPGFLIYLLLCSVGWQAPSSGDVQGRWGWERENQTEVLISFKRKCALLEKIADCAQLRNRSQTFESYPKENSFNLWRFVFQAQSKNVLLPSNIFPVGMGMGNVLLPFRLGTGNPGVGNGKLIFSQTRLIPSSQQDVKGIHWCCLHICSGQVG